jgi:hypothetical protein
MRLAEPMPAGVGAVVVLAAIVAIAIVGAIALLGVGA